MKPILRSYLAEVNLGTTTPGNGQNINVQDYPQLRDVYICGVEVFDSNQLAISPSGKTVVPTLDGLTLTLMDKFNMEMLYQYPAFDLNPANVGGFYRDIKPFYLQLTKSYITILDATTVAANQSVMLNIFYVTAKDWDKYKSLYGTGK
jgi:hypothetical protein